MSSEPSLDTNVDDEVVNEVDDVGETSIDEELNGVDERDCVAGDMNVVDEPDRACELCADRGGTGCLDTVRCQSDFSPDGLFLMVGLTSSRLMNTFVRLRALQVR